MTSLQYWEHQFEQRALPHSEQNYQIGLDFLKKSNLEFNKLIANSNSIIEIGCGTGELSYIISQKFSKKILGTDLSQSAINYANKNYANDLVKFEEFNILSSEISQSYDLAICSNVLEHFKNPFIIIDKILLKCKSLIILVPYNQPNIDGFEYEGGAGHVFQFTQDSFSKYKVIDSFIFQTNGWQHSSNGETPLQLAIALNNRSSND